LRVGGHGLDEEWSNSKDSCSQPEAEHIHESLAFN